MFPGEECVDVNLPMNFPEGAEDADLYIMVTAENAPAESYVAWASSCLLSTNTRRPIAGQINFNIGHI